MTEPHPIEEQFDAQEQRTEAAVQSFQRRARALLAGPPKTPAMLVVEDHPMVGPLYRRKFSPDATVELVTSAEDALAAIARDPRLVLIDLDLGDGMTGIELAQAIDHPLVVLMSAHPGELRAAAKQLRVAAILDKPAEPGQVERIRALLRGHDTR